MSRDKKRQLVWYQIDDAGAIARHLEKMAARGWLLEAVDNWWYTYRRAEPVQVKYTAAFFPDASVYDPRPTEGQETYADYCRAAGWELAAVYGPIQYFRSTRPDPLPIETDESVRLTAIRRTMRKTFVLSNALQLLIALLNLPVLLLRFDHGPLDFFSSGASLGHCLLTAALALSGVGFLLDYFIWVLRSKRSVARGGRCCKPHTRIRLWASVAMLAVCAAVLLGYFMDFAGLRTVLAIYLAIYGGVILLSRWVLRRLKRSGASRGDIRGLFIVYAIVAGLVVGFGAPFLFARLADAGIIRIGREPAETYTYVSSTGSFRATRNVYQDELPVKLEDLGYTVTEDDHCSYKAEVSRSPLAVHREYTQDAMNFESELPRLYYQTYETRWPWLLETCWRELTKTEKNDPWPMEELTPAPWGAVAAYKDLAAYCLLYPDRIVTFHLGNDAAPQQIEHIAQVLTAEMNT